MDSLFVVSQENSIKYRILDAAAPYLEGKTVKDLVIGISLIGCQLSDDSLGVSYMLRHGLPPECSAFGYAQEAIGKPAAEIARWFVDGQDNLQRSIGNAVLTAASQALDIADDTDTACFFGMDIKPTDTLGMIGLIKPVAKVLENKVKEFYVFDAGASAFGNNVQLCSMDMQPEILPKCTKMIITGSSTINGSIDELLAMCSNAEQIALVGSSTPMFPEAWKETNVLSLAGSWWKNGEKDNLFKAISLGGGIAQVQAYVQKKIAYVK